MEIREMLGQKLVFGFHGTQLTEEFKALIRRYKIGNVILFLRNVESASQLRQLCCDIQTLIREETGYPAFIIIDQEGGMVSRLPEDAVDVPGAMALAATGDPENARLASEITIRQLAERIVETVGYQGKLTFDSSKPDGTMRKLTDPSKLHALGWHHKIEIEEGVQRMYEWYLK